MPGDRPLVVLVGITDVQERGASPLVAAPTGGDLGDLGLRRCEQLSRRGHDRVLLVTNPTDSDNGAGRLDIPPR